jgi:hypothetical protein
VSLLAVWLACLIDHMGANVIFHHFGHEAIGNRDTASFQVEVSFLSAK